MREPLPDPAPRLTFRGELRAFCCPGCVAAARFVEEAGIPEYYAVRARAGPVARASGEDYVAWLHPAVLSEHVRPVAGGLEITVLTAQMRCAACAWLVDRAARSVPGVIEATANAVTGRIRIQWDPARAALPAILERLDELGFAPHLGSGAQREADLRQLRRRDLTRLGVAGLGVLQAMMLSEALYLDTTGEMSLPTRDFFRWITFLVATPVVFYAGWPFLAGLAREVRLRRFGMDTLIGGSTLLAYAGSLVETVRGGPQVWFDAAVMFVFLLLLARHVEAWARRGAAQQIDTLARARPALAWRDVDGTRERVATVSLGVGDAIFVAAGEVVPADATALDAIDVDESLLTGEATPVAKASGDFVAAGSVCLRRAGRLRVVAGAQQSRLALLVRLLEGTRQERPAIARMAERVAAAFVSVTLVIAVGTLGGWLLVDASRAFPIMLAVLAVACPCALALAVPVALARATSVLATRGVLVVDADALETLANADLMLFDKTGTLTRGKPRARVAWVDPAFGAAAALAHAAALESGSTHPLAGAFPPPSTATPVADALATVPGAGIEGRVAGRRLRLGTAPFATGQADDGAVWLGDGERALARFAVDDALRDDAAEATAQLEARGLALEITSGDAPAAVAAAAQALGIATFRARQVPGDKLARLRELQRDGRVVAMVGDGINDAPVLAGANVSLSFANASPIAHRASDVVIVADAMCRIPGLVDVARRTRHIMRQNLAWAGAYNLIAIPAAVTGHVAPWQAALGMALSSLGVTLNALRLRTEQP